jgi:hypothetical protein
MELLHCIDEISSVQFKQGAVILLDGYYLIAHGYHRSGAKLLTRDE